MGRLYFRPQWKKLVSWLILHRSHLACHIWPKVPIYAYRISRYYSKYFQCLVSQKLLFGQNKPKLFEVFIPNYFKSAMMSLLNLCILCDIFSSLGLNMTSFGVIRNTLFMWLFKKCITFRVSLSQNTWKFQALCRRVFS